MPVWLTKPVLAGTGGNGAITKVPVTTSGHAEVAIHDPRLPFGEVSVESLTPIFQTDAVYGVNATEVSTSTDGTGGSATAANNLFAVSTGGTTAGYFGALQSRKRLRYRPGQGVVARYTAVFETGIASVVQVAGVGSAESGFFFGYNGTSFGVLHNTGGVREIQTLTVTAGATGAETATVTLNGVATNVSVTSGSTTLNAYEISKGTFPGWKAEQRGATVVFVADAVGNKANTFSLATSGGGTLAGSFAETLAGVAATDNWVPQASWNGDTLDGSGSASNPSGATLDPTKGNVYQIGIQYLGFGAVTLSIETTPPGNNPDFSIVHTFRFPNSQTGTSVSQPSFPFTMSAANVNTGVTAAKTVRSASFGGFIAGRKVLSGPRMSYFIPGGVTSSTSAYVPLFTVRNSLAYATRANQSVVNLLSVSGSGKSTNGVTGFYLIRDATLTGTPNFTSFATASSTYWDTAATACTFSSNSQVIWSASITGDGQILFSFSDDITLQPGETVTLAVRSVTGTATCLGQINTREDQ